jgi:hypothetical protein
VTAACRRRSQSQIRRLRLISSNLTLDQRLASYRQVPRRQWGSAGEAGRRRHAREMPRWRAFRWACPRRPPSARTHRRAVCGARQGHPTGSPTPHAILRRGWVPVPGGKTAGSTTAATACAHDFCPVFRTRKRYSPRKIFRKTAIFGDFGRNLFGAQCGGRKHSFKT